MEMCVDSVVLTPTGTIGIIGTKERVWLDMLLFTGPRRGDVVMLGKQHVKTIRNPDTGAAMRVISFKTEKRKKGKLPTEVTIPILDVLQRTLDAGPCGDLAFIVGDRGRPLTKESFGNAFSEAARKAGVNKSAHGVRKIAAQTAAENGASSSELMALFGWVSIQMAERYTKGAERERMGARAGHKMEKRGFETAIPAPSKKGA